ncbi:MAG: amidohydrolase, partial [Deltaproteobacteria bacterium]
MEDLSTRIEPRALAASVDAVMDEVIELRRWLHAHPEPSGEEYETAATVARRLRALGLEVREGVGGTGVVGLLCARPEAPWLALRADMDALPVTDEKTADYRSRRDGCAHACGHDAHTAMLLGAAIVLAGLREHLRCNLAFVFQPAEETCAGAAAMLADGLF